MALAIIAVFAPHSPAQKPAENSAPTEEQKPEEPALPKLSEMSVPSAEVLLTKPPLDWIVLNNNDVVVAQPVYPRPNTLQKMQKRIEEFDKRPRPKTPEGLKERKEKRDALHYLEITLPATENEESPEYRLHMRYVKEVIHHEELMLRRVDEFVKEDKLRDAFEMLFGIERRLPNWPGVKERRNRLLFAEAGRELDAKNFETALVRLEELHNRDVKFAQLADSAGEAVDQLIAGAVELEDFRRARHFLTRLRRISASHPVAVKWTGQLKSRSATLFDRAQDASQTGAHDVAAALAEKASRTWPLGSPQDRDTYRRISNRFQRLKVGVLQLPGETGAYPALTDADRRFRRLTQATLFEVDASDEVPHYRTRFFEHWEPNDLGRQTVFTLRRNRQYWETTPVLGSLEIVTAFSERFDPSSPFYDERFATYVDSVTVQSPSQFVVNFGRVPLRIEALFDFPIRRDKPRATLREQKSGDGAQRSGSGIVTRRFQLHKQNEKQAVFRRSIPEPDGVSEYHVAEIIEQKYDSHERAIQGLLRDEVSVLPHIRLQDLVWLQNDNRFFVDEYSMPVTHVLQFNPQSKPLGSRELRAALVYGLDRQRTLDEMLLRDVDPRLGKVVSAPWHTGSYAFNTLLDPRDYDITLAFSLSVAAGKSLGGEVPELKMVCAPDPIAQAAAAEFITQWNRIGINVQLVDDDGQRTESGSHRSPLDDWDIVYRKVRMAEPLVDLWPFLTFDRSARVRSLSHLPDWLRQELVELDNAGDWNSATTILHRLHRQLWSEVWLIPLWEVTDYFVIRKNIARGRTYSAGSSPMSLYQGVERWIVRQ